MPNPEFHDCPDCHYRWRHGENGSHYCGTLLKAENERLRHALESAKEWLEGWASAESELAVIRAALSDRCETGEAMPDFVCDGCGFKFDAVHVDENDDNPCPVCTESAFGSVLIDIARGRTDCGRPLGGRIAQEAARVVLIAQGWDWSVEGDSNEG